MQSQRRFAKAVAKLKADEENHGGQGARPTSYDATPAPGPGCG